MELPGDALVNYILPNNQHVFWGLPIVIYPYITGLMAGAFVVSALYHVFGVKQFKPIEHIRLSAKLYILLRFGKVYLSKDTLRYVNS